MLHLRPVLFGIFLLVLSRYVRPLYRQAVEHWTAYFAVAPGIYITFNYYVLSADDIIVTLTEQAIPLLLVIFIGLAAYGSIFLSLKNLQREFRVKDENRKMQVEQEYLQLAVGNMSGRLMLMEHAIHACGKLPENRTPISALPAGAWAGFCWRWKPPVRMIPNWMKVATLPPEKIGMEPATEASLPLPKSTTVSCCIKSKTAFFGCVF